MQYEHRNAMTCITAFAACVAMSVSAANVATCTWSGPASGGNWMNAANWTIVRASGSESLTDEQVLDSFCSWNLNALSDGAVVTNTSSSLKIGGITFNATNRGRITLDDTDGASFKFGPDTWISVAAGNTIICRMRQPDNTEEYSGNDRRVATSGDGTFEFRPNGAYATRSRDYQPCGGTTMRLCSNMNLQTSWFTPWNTSVVAVEGDVKVGRLNGGDTGTTLRLEGGLLRLTSADQVASQAAVNMKMPTRGTGSIIMSGGQDYNWTGALDYTGLFSVLNGRASFSAGVSAPTSVEMRVDGGGEIAFAAPQTLGIVSGDSPAGRISVASGGTLTVSGTNAAASSRFEGAVSGVGDFVKSGSSYDLTLAGANSWTGDALVNAGTLCIRRPETRPGLVAQWTFDDSASLGADSGPTGIALEFPSGNGGQVSDGVGGRPGLRLWSQQYFIVPTFALTADNGFWKYNSAGSISFWMKPNLSDCTTTTYIFRRGNWSARSMFMLWLNASTRQFRLSVDEFTKTSDALNVYATADTISDGKWHHVVCSYGDGKIQLWYDGALLGESQCGIVTMEKANATPLSALTFGTSEYGHRLAANMDDVCVWNHALSESEVLREYSLLGEATFQRETLPAPVAHWKFDDDANPGKNEMGSGDLVANSPASSTATLSSSYSPFGKMLLGSAMRMADNSLPQGTPIGTSPCSLSVRAMPVRSESGLPIVYLGTDNWAQRFYISYGGTPRTLNAQVHNGANEYNLKADISDCNRTMDCNWINWTVTYNPKSHVMRLYRDGILVKKNNDVWCDLPSSGNVYVNWQPGLGGQKANNYIDDLRIYNCELTPYEVKALARSFETGGQKQVLPVGSTVAVSSGAAFAVEGSHITTNAMSGAGDVVLRNGARFCATDWSGFTGSVTGSGELVVARGCQGPISAQVSVPVSFQDGVISVSAANLTQPMVRTSGKVYLRDAMRVELSPSARLDDVSGHTYKLAECSGVIGAPDSSGLTIDSRYSAWDPAPKATLRFNNGLLTLRVSSVGTVIKFR